MGREPCAFTIAQDSTSGACGPHGTRFRIAGSVARKGTGFPDPFCIAFHSSIALDDTRPLSHETSVPHRYARVRPHISEPINCFCMTSVLDCPLIMHYHSDFTPFNNCIISSGDPMAALSTSDDAASIRIKKEATEIARIKTELKVENPRV